MIRKTRKNKENDWATACKCRKSENRSKDECRLLNGQKRESELNKLRARAIPNKTRTQCTINNSVSIWNWMLPPRCKQRNLLISFAFKYADWTSCYRFCKSIRLKMAKEQERQRGHWGRSACALTCRVVFACLCRLPSVEETMELIYERENAIKERKEANLHSTYRLTCYVTTQVSTCAQSLLRCKVFGPKTLYYYIGF